MKTEDNIPMAETKVRACAHWFKCLVRGFLVDPMYLKIEARIENAEYEYGARINAYHEV